MKTRLPQNMLIASVAMLMFICQVSAQNKNIDKGKEILGKAMEQTGAKRQELINKAREDFQKGGMKPQEIAVQMGDAYLAKNDLPDATNSYNSASKEDKKEGLKKVADAYVEDAFSGDEKNQNKSLSKAMQLFTKADAVKEGARSIGDKFYEKGEGSYNQAINYYVIGDGAVKIEAIAKEYFDKGGDNEDKAAETYLKLKNTDGAKKAGDIYYNRKEYAKAIDAYLSGGVGEGIQKYADYLYDAHRDEEANALIMKLADAYADKKDDEDMEKLAAEVMAKGSYGMAAKIYDKASNSSLGDKCRAYDALLNLRLDEAKGLFNTIGDAATVKMITDNEKALKPLADLAENFNDLLKGVPSVNYFTDSVTGKSVLSSSDQKMLEDYYKSIRDQIIKNVNDVSTNYNKLASPDLKKYVRQGFLKYGAIRNILDKETFLVKKQKQDIKAKDLIL